MSDSCRYYPYDYIIDIQNKVPKEILYECLAEEASELAQAALKMVRVIKPGNPTPISEKEAMDNLIEEYTDVLYVAKFILGLEPNNLMGNWKMIRWAKRLEQEAQNDCADACPL